MKPLKGLLAIILQIVLTSVCSTLALGQLQQEGQLKGQVLDELGGAIVGASVVLSDSGGLEKKTTTDDQGIYNFERVHIGSYSVRVVAQGFALFAKAGVTISQSKHEVLNIKLAATVAEQNVSVLAAASHLSIDPAANGAAIVIKGRDLDSLPDDPDELASQLQAIAGPAAGPNGGQLFIDGFLGGRAPRKSAIREIQLNQNPFSAENDRIGYGRIDISTKPGAPKFHGGLSALFNDEALNSRNPFSLSRPPFQIRSYGGSLTGPLATNRASFFFTFFRREIDDNSIINATVLDRELNIVPFRGTLSVPRRFVDLNPRVDFQLNKNNNLTARYVYSRSGESNLGTGDLALPSCSYSGSASSQVLQLTETAIISSAMVNEARFQFSRAGREYRDASSDPSVTVLDAFIGGGSQVGGSTNTANRWELQDYTTWITGKHTVKFGGRLRGAAINDVSFANFEGAFLFAGGPVPALDSSGRIVRDTSGRPEFIVASSLERYRRTLLFANLGSTRAQITAIGGGPALFTLAAGDPRASLNQFEFGGFAQDDWRLRPDFLLSIGLRYEAQSNVHNNLNFAPRIAFAWSPGINPTRPVKTVIRGGAGIFFDRIGDGLTLQSIRFDGHRQQQFIVSDPAILESFPSAPSAESLAAFAAPQTIWRVAGDIRSPYTIMSSISIEQQLPHAFTVTLAYINGISVHNLRARNISAPLPGDGTPPFGTAVNIFEYESSGISRQNLLAVNAYNRLNKRFTLFASYVYAKINSDTDGASGFPANGFDLGSEYGRSALDIRHRVFAGGTINLPWRLSLNPFIVAASGAPFNITTGVDSNGDTLFTDRPAFAADLNKPGVKLTRFGAFDLNPAHGEKIIPRNFGNGPSSLLLNLRIGKTFALGSIGKPSNAVASGQQRAGAAAEQKPYSLTVGVMASNILNHVNRAMPIGNLSSAMFGQSIALAGGGLFGAASSNRRIDLQLNFTF